jgi:hypothetical protein
VGEVNAVRLSRINEPWDLFPCGYVFLGKFLLFGVFSKGGFGIIVAHHASLQLGDADKGSVLSEAVAIKTSLLLRFPFDADVGVGVKHVVELDGLGLVRIKKNRKDEPSDSQGGNHTGKEVDETAPEGLRHEVSIVRKHGVDDGRDPSSLGWFFRGMLLMFHGVDPSFSSQLILLAEKER